MRIKIEVAMAVLLLASVSARVAAPSLAAQPGRGCLDHSRLMSKAAYHPDTAMPSASCGHLLSTDTVVRSRAYDRT